MLQNILLSKCSGSDLSVDPSKTIFWVGAGVGFDAPCSLPLGNGLTDAYLKAALGEERAEEFILYWNNHIPRIRECVDRGDWRAPSGLGSYSLADVRSGKAWDRPRLEFIIGEVNKLDQEFQGVGFRKPENHRRYARKYSIEAISHFAEAKPNLLHYWLADFARAGATIITANFDTCIEKAIIGDTLPAPVSRDGIRGIETGAGFVYHFHGVATDQDIQVNLGATVNNISKRLPGAFTEKLQKCFEEGCCIVFVGYSGLDFFDVQPFFEGLKGNGYSGTAIYLHFCGSDAECGKAVGQTKRYQYLLTPFENQKIVYGDSLEFFTALGAHSGVKRTRSKADISTARGTAFERTKEALESVTSGMDDTDREAYHFLNLFRLASQLNINPVNFYPDWGERIRDIYFDWKHDARDDGTLRQMFETSAQINECVVEDIRYNNWRSTNPAYLEAVADIAPLIAKWIVSHRTDLTKHLSWKRKGAPKELLCSYVDQTCRILEKGAYASRTPEEEDIERDTVHYLCGWQTKKLYALWAVPIVRYAVYPKLGCVRDCITRILEYPFTSLRYRTYYLSLCRQRDAIRAMLGGSGADANGYYGDIQQEWNICMETPNFYDARLTVRARMLQFWIMVCKLKLRKVRKYKELLAIYRELEAMRADVIQK